MKHHMPGFVPANFKLVGKILLIIGLVIVGYTLVTQNYQSSSYPIILGIVLIVISLYLIKIVPRE